jgi:hypothetical protein
MSGGMGWGSSVIFAAVNELNIFPLLEIFSSPSRLLKKGRALKITA